MKLYVKIISAFLIMAMIVSAVPFSVSAYGSEDGKLAITHINTFDPEGAGVIFTPTIGDTVLHALTYWVLVTFDWDSAENCFKVTKVQSTTGDKSNTEIPKTGFVYGVNTGNNYPYLYEQTGDSRYKGKPNYVNDRTSKSYQYAKTLAVGTKAYLYRVNLIDDVIDVRGDKWYEDSFVTNSYIKIGTPDPTGTPYDPSNPEEIVVQHTIGLTHINTTEYVAGMSKIFTRAFGANILSQKTSGSYQWWRVAVFDWDDNDGCYKVISFDTNAGNDYPKYAIIPENGFAIAAITGNDVSKAAYDSIGNLKVGTKAYVYGVDIAAGTMTEGAKITINLPDTALTPYTPSIGSRLAAPDFTNMTARTVTKKAGFTIQWSAVQGATEYVVNVNDMTVTNNGPFIVENKTVTGTSFTIEEDNLKVGNNYMVTVYATGTGKAASMLSRAKLCVISEEAFSSNLCSKKIVAFGDSLTNRGVWINLLAGEFGGEFINSGVGGNNSTQGRARFKRHVLDYNPDIVLINFGMNDQAITNGNPILSVEKYTENLEYFAKTLTDAGIDVVFVTPNKVCTAPGYHNPGSSALNYGTDSMLKYCDAMRKVAIKYGCGLVDINYECSFEDLTEFCASGDGIHQSQYGHQKYAEYIGNYLAAVYDNKNSSSVEIKFQDTNGQTVAQSVTLKGAVGANVIIPGIELEGYTLNSTASNYKFTSQAGSITFTYTPIEIELKEDSGFTVKDNLVYINAEKMTQETLLSKVKTAGVTCVLSSNNYVGTGTKLQLKSGSEVICELIIILPGDVDGNGIINQMDYYKLKKSILGSHTLENEYFTAGDLSDSGKLDPMDAYKMKKHILGTKKLF